MTTSQPKLKTPPGACDCHMHIYDPRFALATGAHLPEPPAPVSEYREVQLKLGLERVVVVQSTAYGKDNSCVLQAMKDLGNARGIAIIDDSASDAEIERLTAAGMRGVRFRMLDTPELPYELLPKMGARLAAFGWHIQFQMDGRYFGEREALLKGLPCAVVIEHVGKFLEPVPPSHPGFESLMRLIDTGRFWVKLSAAYMTSKSGPPFYDDVGVLAKELVSRAPERMLWASNWPHPLWTRKQNFDEGVLLDVLLDWAPDEKTRNRILVDNPARLYGFSTEEVAMGGDRS